MKNKRLPKWAKEAKKAMIDRDLTNADLAKAVGLTSSYTSNILRGTVVSRAAVHKISHFLGIDPGEDIRERETETERVPEAATEKPETEPATGSTCV